MKWLLSGERPQLTGTYDSSHQRRCLLSVDGNRKLVEGL